MGAKVSEEEFPRSTGEVAEDGSERAASGNATDVWSFKDVAGGLPINEEVSLKLGVEGDCAQDGVR